MTMSSLYSQPPDLNPVEHLWDVVEREINLEQMHDAIMSVWTKISECFQHLVEYMPQRIKAVLKAKGGRTRYQQGVPNKVAGNDKPSDYHI